MKKANTTRVTLRYKWGSNFCQHLYIDYYPPIIDDNGNETRREFLRMKITPLLKADGTPKGKKTGVFPIKDAAKCDTNEFYTYSAEDNAKIEVAQTLVAKRQKDAFLGSVISEDERKAQELNKRQKEKVFDFINDLMNNKGQKRRVAYKSVMDYLKAFATCKNIETLQFSHLTTNFCDEFVNYLKTTKLVSNTISLYCSVFRTIIKRAYENNYLKNNIKINQIAMDKVSTREYLNIDELYRLEQTPCDNEVVKNMCLFSAYTGLRHGDIIKLTWNNVIERNSELSVRIRMQKTQRELIVPISKKAQQFLPLKTDANDERIFDPMCANRSENYHLKMWVARAGINRKITFHCFRHTFAMIQLENGTGLDVIQKMLGHTNIATTQIYAKVSEKMMREAVERIK